MLVQRVHEAAGPPSGLAAMSSAVGASANEPAIVQEPAKNLALTSEQPSVIQMTGAGCKLYSTGGLAQ